MKVILLVREYRAVLWGWRKWRTYQEWNATARVNHRPKYIVGHLFPTNGPPCITLSFWCVLSLQLAIKIVITGLYKHFCKHFFFFKWHVIFNVYYFIITFSLVVASGGHSLVTVHELPTGVGFSCCRAEARGRSGFRSWGSWALEHRL